MSTSLREEVLARDACRCRRCGFAPEDGKGLEVSHITPRLRGGPDLLENVALLCTPCHTDWHRAERLGVEFSVWVAQATEPVAERPRRRGRPEGREYPRLLSYKFTESQAAAITGLARKWQTTEAEAVRRAVLETARREKVL